MFFFRLHFTQITIGFQVLQQIAFLVAYVYICYPGIVIGKNKEVVFSKEVDWFDETDQVFEDQLRQLLCMSL